MQIFVNIADGMIIYTLILLGVVALLYLLERFHENNNQWELSRSQLMVCKSCGRVFLLRRQERNKQCPDCGKSSSRFRIPHTGV